MNLDQTKCDHCGKVHNTPHRDLHMPRETGLLSVPLNVAGKYHPKKYLDFCNEDCLRDHLVKRKAEAEASQLKKETP